MSAAGFALRRVVVVLAVTAVLLVALVIRSSDAQAGVTVGCFNASQTIESTTLSAHWCWDKALNLTDLSWGKSQGTFLDGFPFYFGCGTDVISRAGGIGQHTASQVFRSDWCPDYGDTTVIFVEYWAHVVGGSHNLDFVKTGVTTS
jgi:hypothetical protein